MSITISGSGVHCVREFSGDGKITLSIKHTSNITSGSYDCTKTEILTESNVTQGRQLKQHEINYTYYWYTWQTETRQISGTDSDGNPISYTQEYRYQQLNSQVRSCIYTKYDGEPISGKDYDLWYYPNGDNSYAQYNRNNPYKYLQRIDAQGNEHYVTQDVGNGQEYGTIGTDLPSGSCSININSLGNFTIKNSDGVNINTVNASGSCGSIYNGQYITVGSNCSFYGDDTVTFSGNSISSVSIQANSNVNLSITNISSSSTVTVPNCSGSVSVNTGGSLTVSNSNLSTVTATDMGGNISLTNSQTENLYLENITGNAIISYGYCNSININQCSNVNISNISNTCYVLKISNAEDINLTQINYNSIQIDNCNDITCNNISNNTNFTINVAKSVQISNSSISDTLKISGASSYINVENNTEITSLILQDIDSLSSLHINSNTGNTIDVEDASITNIQFDSNTYNNVTFKNITDITQFSSDNCNIGTLSITNTDVENYTLTNATINNYIVQQNQIDNFVIKSLTSNSYALSKLTCLNLTVQSSKITNFTVTDSSVQQNINFKNNQFVINNIIQLTNEGSFSITNDIYNEWEFINCSIGNSVMKSITITTKYLNIDNVQFKSLKIYDIDTTGLLISNSPHIVDFYLNNLYKIQLLQFKNNVIGTFKIEDLNGSNHQQSYNLNQQTDINQLKYINLKNNTIYDADIAFGSFFDTDYDYIFDYNRRNYKLEGCNNNFYKFNIVSKGLIQYVDFVNGNISYLDISHTKNINISGNEIYDASISYSSDVRFVSNKKQQSTNFDDFNSEPFEYEQIEKDEDVKSKVIISNLSTPHLQFSDNTVQDIYIQNVPITKYDFYDFAEDVNSLHMINNIYLNELNLHNCNVKQLYVINCAIKTLDIDQNYLNIQKLVVYDNKTSRTIINNSTMLDQLVRDEYSLDQLNIDYDKQLAWIEVHNCYNDELILNSPNYTYIDLSNNNLNKLTFSEKPTNLTYFDVSSNNSIPYVKISSENNDLSGLSKLEYVDISNNNFQYFNCNNCSLLNFICENNPNLQWLHLQQNRIQNCQIYNCPNLNSLDLYYQHYEREYENQKKQKVKQLVYPLTKLVCSNTKLYYLNIQLNKSISYIDLSSDKLTNINIQYQQSNTPKLTYLNVSNNLFHHLDVGSFTSLKYFDCSYNNDLRVIFNFSSLQSLKCQRIGLYQLDLSNANKLKYIYVRGNYITKIDLSNTNASIVDARDNNIHTVEFGEKQNVTAYLQNNNLTLINSKNSNNIYFDKVEQFYTTNSSLQDDKINNITHLCVDYNDNINYIISAQDKKIEYIELKDKIGDIYINNSNLRTVKLTNCDSEYVSFVNDQLQRITILKSNIKYLYLSGNHITYFKCDKLSDIKKIDLSNCEIDRNNFNKIINNIVSCIDFENAKNGQIIITNSKILPYQVLSQTIINKFNYNNWNIISD